MNTFQVVRIVFLLVLIFVAGVWTGRFTAPKTQLPPVSATARGRSMTAELALERLKADISITPEQELKLRRIFEEIEIEIAKYPPRSMERVEVLRRYAPRMKEALDSRQDAAIDRYVRDVEQKLQATRRRRGAK